MIGDGIDAATSEIAVKAKFCRCVAVSKECRNDIDFTFQVVKHGAGTRGGVDKERFGLGDASQISGPNLFHAKVKGALPLGGFDCCRCNARRTNRRFGFAARRAAP